MSLSRSDVSASHTGNFAFQGGGTRERNPSRSKKQIAAHPSGREESSRAFMRLSRYLRAGSHSIQEARRYLARQGLSGSAAERLIEVCIQKGELDDEACALLWADLWSRRGYSWLAIRERLAAKGFEEEAMREAARRVGAGAADDLARARLVVAQRGRRLWAKKREINGMTRAQQSRLTRILSGRGFEDDIIAQALKDEPADYKK